MSERQIIRFPADIVPDGVIDEFQPRELIIEPILYKQVLPGIIALGGSYAQADFDRVSAMEVQAAQLSWQVPQMLTLEEIGEILGIAGGDLAYADISGRSNAEGQIGAGGFCGRSLFASESAPDSGGKR
jgi:hypothetical protein